MVGSRRYARADVRMGDGARSGRAPHRFARAKFAKVLAHNVPTRWGNEARADIGTKTLTGQCESWELVHPHSTSTTLEHSYAVFPESKSSLIISFPVYALRSRVMSKPESVNVGRFRAAATSGRYCGRALKYSVFPSGEARATHVLIEFDCASAGGAVQP